MKFFLPLTLLPALASLSGAQQQTTGDAYCSPLVCISAVKTASEVTYTLSRTMMSQMSDPEFGWIAMGFGAEMTNSPMVIAWPNAGGSITLSQRSAPLRIQPTPIASPPAVATLKPLQSFFNSSPWWITFSLPDDSIPGVVPIIWAYSTTNPGSSSPYANLFQHQASGVGVLDLTRALLTTTAATQTQTAASTVNTIFSSPQPASDPSSALSQPYTELQSVLVAHAVFGGLGTMVMIPIGVILARLLRTFWPTWSVAHWMVHVFFSLPFIVIAFALGVHATNMTFGSDTKHFTSSRHRSMGLALFLLVFFQVAFGSWIHWTPKHSQPRFAFKHKTYQNWLHSTVGVAILVLGWSTCFAGFNDEWERYSGLALPHGVRIAWGVLLTTFSLLYLLGLILLPRQFRADRRDALAREESIYSKDHYPLRHFASPPGITTPTQ